MSDGIIRLSEEIDQVIRVLDGVVGSYSSGDEDPVGYKDGEVARAILMPVRDGQSVVNKHFLELDETLKLVTEAMRASVADQRATEAEVDDKLRRLLQDVETAANTPTPPPPGHTNLGDRRVLNGES